MSKRWEFTDLEFRVLWERFVGRRLPGPLTFRSDIEKLDDFEHAKFETWDRLQPTVDPALREILPMIQRPEVFVRVRAWRDDDRENPQEWIRIRAARSDARGYLIVQHPGRTQRHASGYTLIDCGPHGLADGIVELLPQVGAGRHSGIALRNTEVPGTEDDWHRPRSLVSEDVEYADAYDHDRFFGIPAIKTGTITLHQGQSSFGPRGLIEHSMLWRDLPDDGRYLIELPSDSPTAVGVSARELSDRIDAWLDKLHSRVENHWEVQG
ncbi:ESX secretion-associated protein EspG [Nocardia huaxiensis]|uniref:ESX secretion-associated protein EspG n=1 Tax=Nocardia huaxiensis TaxID=2755382 RepID=A0A7D6ZJ68_9NOCA|nr:ESX secretion-associated protein EspG [Nocardia huaxiensis]QLY31847.1 ESX secretion-associated protein EspG [Nocardia huaxiensis]UFS95412.1 ESX secretion-associated protein EspG [Nocardia huaxiensis]